MQIHFYIRTFQKVHLRIIIWMWLYWHDFSKKKNSVEYNWIDFDVNYNTPNILKNFYK